MKTPKTKRTAIHQAVISSLTGETLPIKKKRKAFGQLLTQALPALAVVSLFVPSAAVANFDFNDYGGQGSVVSDKAYDSNGTYIQDVSGTIYGLHINSSEATSVSGADITISGTGYGTVYGGYAYGDASTVDVSGNKVIFVDDSVTSNQVYGGSSTGSGNVLSNEVTITGSEIGADIYGGRSGTGDSGSGAGKVYSNKVTLTDTSVTGSVYGGRSSGGSDEGEVSSNEVSINGGTITRNVYGGYGDDLTGSGETVYSQATVSGNKVYIGTDSSGTSTETTTIINGSVYGGISQGNGKVSSNEVYIGIDPETGKSTEYETTIGSSVYGGYSQGSGDVSSNKVYISNGTISGTVYGSYAGSGAASSNTVSVDSSSAANVYGGHTDTGAANGNTVEITGSSQILSDGSSSSDPTGFVYGGYASGTAATSTASENTVTVDGSAVDYVYGGHSSAGDSSSNKVTITGGSTITYDVYGGHANGGGSASSNTVSVTNSTVTAGNVFGGRVSGDSSTGSTSKNYVTIESSSILAAGNTEVNGYVFGGYISDSNSTGDASGNYVIVKKTDSTSAASVTESAIYGGYTAGSGNTDGNVVYVTDGSTASDVYGGHSVIGEANGNYVIITGASAISNTVYGGHAAGSAVEDAPTDGSDPSESATSNTVYIGSESSASYVYGGRVTGAYGNAEGNTVYIAYSSEISADVYGGYVSDYTYEDETNGQTITVESTGGATGNTVTITDSSVGNRVYGGLNEGSGDSSSNKVSVDNSTITNTTGTGGVFGGHSNTGNAESNTVEITGGSTISADVYGGYTETGESASKNEVTVSSSSEDSISSANNVYGGHVHSGTGDAEGNTVTVTGSTISNYVYGGSTVDGKADGNTVIIQGTEEGLQSTIKGRVYGGYTYGTGQNSSASGNLVTVDNSSADSVYGGGTDSSSRSTGIADSNTVTVKNGSTITNEIYGGLSQYSSASSNTVTVDNSSAAYVIGGRVRNTASTGAAGSNTVTVTSGSKITSNVIGGLTQGSGDASSNTVSIDSSSVNGAIYGGVSTSATTEGGTGNASNNEVTLNNTTVTASETQVIPGVGDPELSAIYGGRSSGGKEASSNTVTITGGTITSDIYGGYSEAGAASSNTLTIGSAETTVNGSIYGGVGSSSGEVSNNTITLTDDTTVEGDRIAAGLSDGTGNVENNSVSITGGSVTADIIGGGSYSEDGGSGTVTGNTVVITDGSVEGDIVGSFSTSAGTMSSNSVTLTDTDVSGDSLIVAATGTNADEISQNSVTISGGTITADVGAAAIYSDDGKAGGTVTENSIEISGGAVVTGAVITAFTTGTGDVTSNTLTITDAAIAVSGDVADGDFISAGYSSGSGSVKDNTVTMSSGSIEGTLFGGYSESETGGSITGNTIEVTDGASITGDIFAGSSAGSANVLENTVTLDSATVEGNIGAGYAEKGGTVSENTIDITDTTVNGNIVAGTANGSGKATSNTVNFNSGSITGGVAAGGYSEGTGEVSDNLFNINGGAFAYDNAYGGYSGSGGSVSDNTINLNGGTVSGTLYAGYSSDTTKVENNTINLDGNVESRLSDINVENAFLYGSNLKVATGSYGNTLNIQNFTGKIQNIGAFDNINLDLNGMDLADAVYDSGSIIYLIAEGTVTDLSNSTVNIYNSTTSYNGMAVGFTSESGLSDEYTIFKNQNGEGYMIKDGSDITKSIMVVQDPDKYPDLIAYSEYDLATDDDGTISYIINPETSGTYVPKEGRTVTSLAGAGAKFSIYYAQLDDLRKRLGEVRYGAQDGVWARLIYQEDIFSGTSSYSGRQRWYGLNVGLDRVVSQDEDRMWLLGANFKYGHAKQKVRQSLGGKGDLNSYGVNLYATYANQYGCYADFVVTFDDYHQKLGVKTEKSSSSNGDYSSWGWGASIEIGKMFSSTQNDENWGPWHNHWWVEPQAQLSYYWLKGKDFMMSSGNEVNQHNGQSLVGRLGLVVGKQWSYGGADKVDKRYVQAYVKGGVKHEFLGKQDIKYAGTLYNDRLRGTTGYYGAGVDWNLTKQVKAYAQVERESGGKYRKNIEASIGLKWQF